MEDLWLTTYYTIVILIFLALVYFLVKNWRTLTSPQMTENALRIAKTLRIIAIFTAIAWAIINTANTWDEGGFGIFIIWPMTLFFVGFLSLGWENLMRYRVVLMYVLILVVIFLYITLVSVFQDLAFGGVPGATN